VAGGAGYPFLGADDMADFHGGVIDDTGEVIGGIAIRLEENKVVDGGVFEGNIAVNKVVEGGLALQGDLEADDGDDAFGLFLGTLLGGEVAAVPVVAGRLLSSYLLLAHVFESPGGAVAVVGVALLDEPIGGLLVEVESPGLIVGGIVAADIGAFIPVEAEPFESVHDGFFGAGDFAGDIGVLDAEDEGAAGVAGHEPVEHGGADIADVRAAGGTGGEADSDGCGHGIPFRRAIQDHFSTPVTKVPSIN